MNKHYRSVTLLAIVLIISLIAGTLQAAAAAPQTLQYGSKGSDVMDLQYRLQSIGYFNAAVTDNFGAVTRNALLNFQRDYGLQADGIAGTNTWKMLKKVSVNEPEMRMLTRVIYSEARGEPYIGQVAVGAVVMNRLKSSQFPDTIAGIIFEPWAFTAINDGQYWLEPDETALMAAKEAVKGWDPTGSALYYYNPDTATSKWVWSLKVIKKIGQHVFAK
ncbi:spore cortex-lytic enzyme [Paenibacillus sp. GCM10027626]|uniref:spore cortex-lytic enzyme n=1 Tax=Paenibacillus sp. GCM10027626 TaxID=3273411 RepID=UPI0036442DC6